MRAEQKQELESLAEGYLTASGYAVSRRRADLLQGTRKGLGQMVETVIIWTPTVASNSNFASQEAGYLGRFRDAANQYRSAPPNSSLCQHLKGSAKTSDAKPKNLVSIILPPYTFRKLGLVAGSWRIQ